MGVKGLMSFLQKNGFEKSNFNLEAFRGRKIAIDTNALIGRYYSVAKNKVIDSCNLFDGPPDNKEVIKVTIMLILQGLRPFSKHNITPIFCFDGKLNNLKKVAWQKRSSNANSMKEKLQVASAAFQSGDVLLQDPQIEKDYKKYYRSYYNNKIVHAATEELKVTLKRLGFPVLIGGRHGHENVNPEAEALCAHLMHNGICSAVYSTDSDLLAYGAKRVITSIEKDDGDYVFKVIEMKKVLDILKLSPMGLIEFCIMCGTDYNPNVPGIGPVKALKMLNKYGNIKGIMNFLGENADILNPDEIVPLFMSSRYKWKNQKSLRPKSNESVSSVLYDTFGDEGKWISGVISSFYK